MVDLSDAVNSQLHMSFNGVSNSEVSVFRRGGLKMASACPRFKGPVLAHIIRIIASRAPVGAKKQPSSRLR